MSITKITKHTRKTLQFLRANMNLPKFIVIVLLLLASALFIFKSYNQNFNKSISSPGREIYMIITSTDFNSQSKYYRELIDRVGPEQAQDMLLSSGIPFTGTGHQLNHVAGQYIYDKHGAEGITKCRDYFQSSCYHALLLNVISGDADKDMAIIKKIMIYCTNQGTKHAGQCAHGIGHGYVPAVGYKNLFIALDQCDKIAKSLKDFPLYLCHDGAFMENMLALHEGAISPDRLAKVDDTHYPCDDPRMKVDYIHPCWTYQPALLNQRFSDTTKVIDVCLAIVSPDIKKTCFKGIIYIIHARTENKTEKVFSICNELPQEWQEYCYLIIVDAGFSLGDRKMPFEVCAQIVVSSKQACYGALQEVIAMQAQNEKQKHEWCSLIVATDNKYYSQCIISRISGN